MKKYDVIVLGFGKGGKTLAAKLSKQGKKVALVEKEPQMFGGTCINIGCIPTKTLLVAAEKNLTFDAVMAQKNAVVSRLNQKNFTTLDALVDIYVGVGRFVSNYCIEVTLGDQTEQLEGDVIIINTGATSVVPAIEGIATATNVVDSTGIQQLPTLPKRLGIIGGGNIGVEFATLYAQMGSQVTILEPAPKLFGRDEPFVFELAKDYMAQQNIAIHVNASITKVYNVNDVVCVIDGETTHEFDVVMYATGRKPNVAQLTLENTQIALTDRGAIQVDEFCQTSVKNVFAVGDVNGGLQFTYVSLDDFRIVFNYLNGNTQYNLNTRQNVPSATFINPPLARVGLTQEQAQQQNLPYAVKSQLVATMPRAHVNNDLRGQYQVIVNTETHQILGATFYGQEAHELINLITMAMDNNIPYTYFTKQIFTHPTMAENLNDLFA